ncbi:MAG TPA: PQQ-binding-like beta-propeller repeat protein, partial [Pirellulales bacterium]|nr:PQQ-binding-like beta-propeller repeat protein [Pirellulales bacterium]
LLIGLLTGLIGRPARAQQPGQIQIVPGGGIVQFGGGFRRFPGQGQDSDDTPEGVFLPVDRDTTRQWEKAKSLLDDGHYADAVMLLDEILQRGEDYFSKSDADKPNYQSLKTEAQRLIGNMPAEGREAYELQFGAHAQQMLDAATAAGDIAGLEEIARRYFHTKAGYQATLLLGRHHLDHDRPLAAALCFQRLLDAPNAAATFEPTLSVLLATSWQRGGVPDRAQEVLLSLKKKSPNAELRVAGKTVALFSDDKQALAWLESTTGKPQKMSPEQLQQWALVGGNPARNAASMGGIPLLSPLWRVSTTNHPTLEKSLAGIRQQYVDQGVAAIPSMQPLAVGNLVLMRTARDMLAVDFDSGKRLWPIRSGSDTSLEQMLNSSTSSGSSGTNTIDPQHNPGLIERFWEDATFGTLSCDGQQVYLIDDLDVSSVSPADAGNGPIMFNGRMRINGGGAIIIRGPIGADGQMLIPKRYNKLTAHELRTQGKLKWEVGGQTGEDEPQLAGAFFLGPPLPLEGKLYVLAEMKSSEIKLCVLDAKTGRLDWSQQVAIVEQNIQQDPLRRLAGCSPSYADGVLVCPTTAGAVVAVDIANRTLLWGYQYQRDGSVLPPGAMVLRGGGGMWTPAMMQTNPAERWLDSTVTLADRYTLVTPLESNELHCLNLIDGKLLWKQPRGENLYVGGVHRGTAVLVGRHQISLLTLADERSAVKTKTVELPAGAMPSGRGFLSGDDYFLPLTSAEVAQIDLNSGKIVAEAKSRKGSIPGNLVCYQGEIISQGIDYVESFFQRQPLQERIAKTLEEKPNDPWALAHRGEIELEASELDSAIADLRRAYQSDPDPLNRELLFEALLNGLTKDFNQHHEDLPELEQLVRDDRERGMYLRARAAGLQQTGDISGALDAYLKLAALEPHDDELEDLDTKLSVYRPRWVQAQLHELLSGVKPENRAAIDEILQRQLDVAVASTDTKALSAFVDCFGNHPLADRARELLVDRLTGADTLLEREQLLLALEVSASTVQRSTAMFKLASLLRDAGQWDAALAQCRRLEAQAGDQPVSEGKNVKQLLASLPENSPIRRVAAQDRSWPEGEVKVEKSDAVAKPQMPVFNTEIQGTREPFFSNVLLGRDLQHQEIVGVDGLGKNLFQISLADPNRMSMYRSNAINDYAFVQGHILIVCTGYQVVGLDTLQTRGPSNPVLWTKDLCDLSMANGNFQPPVRQPMPWGGVRRLPNQQSQFGDVALCGQHTLCFQHGRDVTAIDPLTGQVQWVRHGVEIGCDLFGDEEMIVLAPANGKPALVLRTADGQLLGERTLPATFDKRWTSYGHCLLVFRDHNDGNKVTLAMFDPWTQHDVWSETFSGWNNGGNSGLKCTTVDGETVALMQSDGRFVVLNLADGRKLIDQQLEAEQNQHSQLQSIFVLSSSQQVILIANRPAPPMAMPTERSIGEPRNLAVNVVPVNSQMGETITSQLPLSGHVYAFDRATGKPQWTTPAYVDQQCLLLGQPDELPVLTFVRNISTIAMNRNSQPMRGSVLCLDKRNGRLVYANDDLPFINNFEISGKLDDKTVTLSLNNQPTSTAVTLKFTDAPVAPEPPYQAGAFEKAASASEPKE